VGVILKVLPEIMEDGQLINLTMLPEVVSVPYWKDYGQVRHTTDPRTGLPVEERTPMEQPFFPVRSVNTQIHVYNGATVVLGGLITEKRITNEDKTPILGDIPFVGRLFRYKYESSEKRNLLIFVTAKIVDPAGRVVRDMAVNQ